MVFRCKWVGTYANKMSMNNWAKGEVDPIDLDKEYEPVAKPLSVLFPAGHERTIYPMHHQLYTGDSIAIMKALPSQ